MTGPSYVLTETPTAYVRVSRTTAHEPRPFGPKDQDHPSVGRPCPACGVPFAEGDYTTLVALGPGDDEEAQEKCRNGRHFNAVAIECHFACVTGETL